jgi:hypothetical protein
VVAPIGRSCEGFGWRREMRDGMRRDERWVAWEGGRRFGPHGHMGAPPATELGIFEEQGRERQSE